jgi:hypothetical protein
VGRDGKTVLRALREIGINTSARPANGSHRRVDVCECGEPALAVGSRCKAHAREYQREILRAYRERMR